MPGAPLVKSVRIGGWPVCSQSLPGDIFETASCMPSMFTDFTASDRWTKKQVHCLYQALIVAIATRHADAVDVKFLVDGRPVWVALPHPAWVEYKNRTGKLITAWHPKSDPLGR